MFQRRGRIGQQRRGPSHFMDDPFAAGESINPMPTAPTYHKGPLLRLGQEPHPSGLLDPPNGNNLSIREIPILTEQEKAVRNADERKRMFTEIARNAAEEAVRKAVEQEEARKTAFEGLRLLN